jgi:ABC-type multidrug transport system ATPase subunit
MTTRSGQRLHLLLLGLLIALVAVANSQSPCPGLPCRLNNGCACNHSVVYVDPSDEQNYGTCTKCDHGWTGPSCQQPFDSCVNGGTLVTQPVTGMESCKCPAGWNGTSCEEMQCVHASSVVPSPDDNRCERLCAPTFHGLQCQQCAGNAACGAAQVCDLSLLPPAAISKAAAKNLQCDVAPSPILMLLGGGRNGVGGQAMIQCNFEADTSNSLKPALHPERMAQCQLQFFRIEPNASWTDAFFYCSLDNCTTSTRVEQGIKPSWASIPGRDSTSREGARAVLLVCALLLAVNHLVFRSPTPLKRLVLKITFTVLVITLVLVVVIFGFNVNPYSWHFLQRAMNWNATATGAVARVKYDCPVSACTCAPTPTGAAAKYSPHCIGSLFGDKILPGLIHGATVDCDAQTGECTFNQKDLNSPIQLSCRAGDCINETDVSADSADVVPGGTVAAVPTSTTTTHSIAEAVCWFGACFLVIAVSGHFYYSKTTARVAALAFAAKYFDASSAPRSPSRSQSPTGNNDLVDDHSHQPPPRVDSHGSTDVHAFEGPAAAGSDAGHRSPRDAAAGAESVTAADVSEWVLHVHDLCYTVDRPRVEEHHHKAAGGHSAAAAAPPVHTPHQRPRPSGIGGMLHRSRGRKVVLDHVTFTAKPGECLALMGSSGAGKTSLLDLLAARDKSGLVSGTMAVGDQVLFHAAANHPVAAKSASASWFSIALMYVTSALEPFLPGSARKRRPPPGRGRGRQQPPQQPRGGDNDNGYRAAPTSPGERSSSVGSTDSQVVLRVDSPRSVSAEFDASRGTANAAVERARRVQEYRSLVGYVAQEDTLLPTLTVRQTLRFAAELRLPAAISKESIDAIVSQAIDALRLRHCAETMVGGVGGGVRGLSGGERRRVSIGVELVGLPKVLFLDEPTSGLDSENALRVMQCIAALAHGTGVTDPEDSDCGDEQDVKGNPQQRRRRSVRKPPAPFSPQALRPYLGSWATSSQPIVIFSIHQPSADIYRLFDKVLLVDRGRILLHGPAVGAAEQLRATVTEIAATVDADAERARSAPPPRSAGDRAAAWDDGSDNALEDEYEDSILLDTPADPVATADYARRQQQRRRLLRRRFGNPAEFMLAAATTLDARDVQLVAEARKVQLARDENSHVSPSALSRNRRPGEEGQMTTAAKEKDFFRSTIWRQFALLSRRSGWSLFGAYHLIAAHALVVFAVGLMLSALYRAEQLDLPGTLNRAGSLSFLQLFLAFSTLSALEAALAERKLLALEMEGSIYGSFPVLLTRLVFDVIPLRVVPTALLGAIIYAPMGLRVDHGSYFLWYMIILTAFSSICAMLTYVTGLICPSLGSAALLSAVITLWNFVFGGLVVQAETIPRSLTIFRDISPFFLTFESLMVNELDGQTCTFAPSDASGRPATESIPLYCTQYLYNMGLNPHGFTKDVMLLGVWFAVLCVVVWALIARLRFER